MRKWLARLLPALGLLLAAGLAVLYSYRPGMAEYQRHRVAAAPIPAGALTATWLGVTAVLLRDGEHALLVDPFFSRPEGLLPLALNRRIAPDEARIRAWLTRLGVSKLDAVLVSHSHYDHAMDAGLVARLTGAQLLGSASTANLGRGAGLPEAQLTVIAPGQNYRFGDFELHFVESRHAGATGGAPTGEIDAPLTPPAHYLDYKLGGTYSILVAHPQGRVLLHGSAGTLPGALRGERADLVFLGVALIDDLDAYLADVVDAVGAKRIVPSHWDDFSRPLEEPLRPFPVVVRLDRFFAAMREGHPDLRVETYGLAEPVALFAPPP
ncbi:MBL fold metallo-hydrolase [Stagnimonas aquatica]|uniref:MBL fold metallo-hydrolase n=1 Tax=Stagnimonas aquatica TaxID=2689987 RepID=A0A3N0VLH3_9GAMM|nr:MBL fold metallo-hydrolase [Stagnimonas aquatica]ROH93602.1 MBL fold metallo-hydrolase [Stagnimonas aquatica]